MTVKQLKKLLRGLPNDMVVMTPLDDEHLVIVCMENSQILEVEFFDEEGEEETYTEEILLLVGCGCNEEECELPIGEVNSQPELN